MTEAASSLELCLINSKDLLKFAVVFQLSRYELAPPQS